MRNLKLAVGIVLLLVFTGFMAYAETSIADSVAVVSNFKGAGYIYNSGAWKPVEVGMPLYEGDTVATKLDSFVEVVFDSATLVRVDSDSQLKLSELKRNENIARTIFDLVKGRIVAIVDHLKNPESAFEVHTKMAVAAVKGTELAVEEGSLGVYEGSVAWSNADGTKKVQVEFGNESSVTAPGAAPSVPSELKNLLQVKTQLNGMREDVKVFRNLKATNGSVKEFLIQRQKTDASGKVTGSSETNLAVGGVNSKNSEAVDKIHKYLSDRAHKELNNTRSHAVQDMGYVSNQMQADLHLGKTMTDVHGNRIRMEEYVYRPDTKNVDLLSITMRDARMDYLKVENTFNTDLPAVIPKSAWAREWVSTAPLAPVMPALYRTNELIRMSNGDDEVEMLSKFGYEAAITASVLDPSGRAYVAAPYLNTTANKYQLLDYEYSLAINNDIKEHKRYVLMQTPVPILGGYQTNRWIRLEDDKTFTNYAEITDSLSELVSSSLPTLVQTDAKNVLITKAIASITGTTYQAPASGTPLIQLTSLPASAKVFNPGTVSQLQLFSNLDLAAQVTRVYNDGSNLTLKVYLIDDYGKLQKYPVDLADWYNIVFNTNVELQFNSNQFADQGLGIDVVSKLLWDISLNPKNTTSYDNGAPSTATQ